MTLRQYGTQVLHNCALFPNVIEAVFQRIEARAETGSMEARLDDDIEGYTVPVLHAFGLMVKLDAANYLSEVQPHHFMIPALRGEM